MRAFRLAYDGRPYFGFQRQPDVETVEGELFDALVKLGVMSADDSRPPGYAAAGRTDAGVSAAAQTVAFDCPDWCTPRALNGALPEPIRAWARAEAPDDFHATHDAVRREYAYHLYAPESGDPDLDIAAFGDGRARAAFDALCGSNDFHNLTPDERGPSTRRGLSGRLERDGAFLLVEVAAGGFARELVRRLVSLVASVGRGESPLSRVERVLSPEPLDSAAGVPPAPPEPLVLADVVYPMLSFEPDPDAVGHARRAFAARRVDGCVRARTAAGTLERFDSSE